jgi:hypothetical protein
MLWLQEKRPRTRAIAAPSGFTLTLKREWFALASLSERRLRGGYRKVSLEGRKGPYSRCTRSGRPRWPQGHPGRAEIGGVCAVVAIPDMVALGAYRGLQAVGMRIPEDISVVGFDNTYICEFINPPLTTIDIPKDELSRSAVRLLRWVGQNEEPGHELTLATELIVRQSTGPSANARADLQGNMRTARKNYARAELPLHVIQQ